MKGIRISRVLLSLAVVVAVISVAGACRRPARLVLSKDQQARIQESILDAAPTPEHVVNANFGDKVELIGVDMKPANPAPGQEVTVTWYWHCTRKVQDGWKVFVHLELPKGKRMGLDHVPVGELFPMDRWEPGQYVKYQMNFKIDAKQEVGRAVMWAGLFSVDLYNSRGTGERMIVVNRDQVKHDGENRVNVVEFQMNRSATPPAPDTRLTVNPVIGSAPVIDGALDEEAWKGAARIVRLGDAFGKPISGEEGTSVMVMNDNDFIYFGISATDLSIEATLKNRDDQLWTEDVFEIYLDALLDGKNYLEIQVSPANVVFDALFESHRSPKWEDAAKHTVEGLVSAVKLDGTINKVDDIDRGWTMEVKIPVKSIPGLASISPGTTLRANFFRMNMHQGRLGRAHAWGPGGRDFHDLEKMGVLEFSTVVAVAGDKPLTEPAKAAPAAPTSEAPAPAAPAAPTAPA
ncbi:MAG TPA: carbohydrate-binding family 9-like protein, partial [Myxococcota bacterium]|nr:carbohydrate-binding family 9-like protein [Myxococcota bacterium]